MKNNIVIVESPAKGGTIKKYLGKGFEVLASYGHVRDLVKEGLGVDLLGSFQPTYEVLDDKKKVISDLKKACAKSDMVYLATDPDREGEAIAWHLLEALKLPVKKVRRVVFHEITKSAVQSAIENPRDLDIDLVNAQQARRVLDRIVGFEVSPILWKKVKGGLSAGRVQSVSVRLLVEREREIMAFEPDSYFKVTGDFVTEEGVALSAELETRLKVLSDAQALLDGFKSASFSISSVQKKEGQKSPAPPFTTSSLQQEASRKIGFSVSRTMSVAQRLYEEGHITYMRTDSVSLAKEAQDAIKTLITKEYGASYATPRQYATKSKGAQEAHEAIRPSDVSKEQVSSDPSEQKLYDLIRKRTVASQMANAKVERSKAVITASSATETFQASGEIILFDGFLKVYSEGTDDEDEAPQKGALPKISEGQSLTYETILATERFTRHAPRFTEASLVKKLEELGIGRPSTYAPVISTIQKRDYVEKVKWEGKERSYTVLSLKESEMTEATETEMTGAENNKLVPTDIGMVVTDFLTQHFEKVMDYQFTATIEEEFDSISEGNKEWTQMISDFYAPFHEKVEVVTETSERASGERLLGVDPKTKKNVHVRIGRYGPLAQIGDSGEDEDEKPQFASLLKTQKLETITLEEALELFKLPRVVGEYEDKEVVAAIGRYGPYLKFDGLFVSLKEDDPYTVEIERSIELIKEKQAFERDKYIHVFDDHDPVVQVINGRYGPYISIGKDNIKIPKDQDPKELTLEICLKLAEEKKSAPKTKRKGRSKKK
ncbi:type I DNA topoisomerase [Candidatus Marinamargulisbacteria bacterium SCGC AG-439-L15]|nr:type I DNA topoisomerase [Candidatus Marinamargulisbacteria bacterium SCGC AG-439-L15]